MSELKLIHYRNGVYQGQVKSNKRQGKGIMITDQGQIVVGNWKNDKLSGNVLMFMNQSQYSFGEFNRGQLQGWSKFQSNDKILLSEFNASKPINKQLLIEKHQQHFKVTSLLPSSIFECLKQQALPERFSNSNLQQMLMNYFGIKYPEHVNYTLSEYLTEYYKKDQFYQTEVLVNGYLMFRIRDDASVISLGFVINKNDQLVSFGSYVNSKLHGLGCKYENTVRYEGIFQNGFLNGDGLKCASGKYSYGTFQNGTLTNPVYFEQRSLASEEKLKQLKKLTHLTNLNFANIYLQTNLFKFKGTKQIIFELPLKQDFPVSKVSSSLTSAKKPMNLASKLLINRDQPEIKSSVSVVSKTRTMKINNQIQSRVSQPPKSVSIANSITRFKNN